MVRTEKEKLILEMKINAVKLESLTLRCKRKGILGKEENTEGKIEGAGNSAVGVRVSEQTQK